MSGATQPSESQKTLANPANVLVIEDDRVSQRVLSQICSNVGHRVTAVDSLAQAREELQRQILFDLVFLDSHLGKEWGWDFLGELRSDALFRALPVVVYTAHTEKDNLLQYIDLGVQAVRAKPFKGEVVLAEIEKAQRTDWRGRTLHSPASVCERLRISKSDYYAMLSSSALELDKISVELKTLIGTPNLSRINECLRNLRSQGNMIGLPALDAVANAIQLSIGKDELPAAVRSVQRVDDLSRLIQGLCNAFHGESGAQVSFSRPSEQAPALPAATPPPPPADEGANAALYGRKVASGPAWTIGKCFSRLQRITVFNEADIEEIINASLGHQPMEGYLEIVGYVEKIPTLALEHARAQFDDLPDFAPSFARITEQLGVRVSLEEPLRNVERLGLERSLILLQAAKAARLGFIESPLSLSHAMVHSVASGLIAYEMGRMLHLANGHLLFPMGLVHDIGRWAMAIEEPGFYTIVVGMAQTSGTDMASAEKATFGISQQALGRRIAERASLRRLFLDAISHHLEPASPDVASESLVSVALLNIAQDLAYAAAADSQTESDVIRKRILADTHPSWPALAKAGVQLPLPRAELIGRLMSVAATSQWITLVLGNWAMRHRRS